MRRLIYSKQYPKSDIKVPEEKNAQSFTYTEIPGRRCNGNKFINIAADISKTYEYDIEIYETDELIQVLLSFDAHSTSGALNRLFRMADDFSFFVGIKNRDITIAMDYYTVAVCRSGERVMPDNRYYFD